MLLILLFKPLPWHIQTIEQWLNWEILKDLNLFHYLQKSVLQSQTMHGVFELLSDKFYLYDIQMKS